MKVIKVKNEDGVIRNIADSYRVINLITAEISDNVSLAVSEAKDHHETDASSSDRIYYILDGEITVNGKIKAQKGDAIFIPANEQYTFQGTFKAVLVNSPPFKKLNETITR